MKNNGIIIFVHMPKCGGKSIKRALKDIYGDRLDLYYLNPRKEAFIAMVSFFIETELVGC